MWGIILCTKFNFLIRLKWHSIITPFLVLLEVCESSNLTAKFPWHNLFANKFISLWLDDFLVHKVIPHQNPCFIDNYAWMLSFLSIAVNTNHEKTISRPRVVNIPYIVLSAISYYSLITEIGYIGLCNNYSKERLRIINLRTKSWSHI